MTNELTTYRNTPENETKVGWIHLPEYCIGNPDAAFVTHDHRRGFFQFHDGEFDPDLVPAMARRY